MTDRPARFQEGDQYVVEAPCPATVLTKWKAPYTGAYAKTLPVGLRFILGHVHSWPEASISAWPESYEEWEPILVDPYDLSAIEYEGYRLQISLEAVLTFCRRLP